MAARSNQLPHIGAGAWWGRCVGERTRRGQDRAGGHVHRQVPAQHRHDTAEDLADHSPRADKRNDQSAQPRRHACFSLLLPTRHAQLAVSHWPLPHMPGTVQPVALVLAIDPPRRRRHTDLALTGVIDDLTTDHHQHSWLYQRREALAGIAGSVRPARPSAAACDRRRNVRHLRRGRIRRGGVLHLGGPWPASTSTSRSPDDLRSLFEEERRLGGEIRYYDLHEPTLVSAPR
jgi:hypothetical protein